MLLPHGKSLVGKAREIVIDDKPVVISRVCIKHKFAIADDRGGVRQLPAPCGWRDRLDSDTEKFDTFHKCFLRSPMLILARI